MPHQPQPACRLSGRRAAPATSAVLYTAWQNIVTHRLPVRDQQPGEVEADRQDLDQPEDRVAEVQRASTAARSGRAAPTKPEPRFRQPREQEAAKQQLLRQRRADADHEQRDPAALSPCSISWNGRRSCMTASGFHAQQEARPHSDDRQTSGTSARSSDPPPATGGCSASTSAPRAEKKPAASTSSTTSPIWHASTSHVTIPLHDCAGGGCWRIHGRGKPSHPKSAHERQARMTPTITARRRSRRRRGVTAHVGQPERGTYGGRIFDQPANTLAVSLDCRSSTQWQGARALRLYHGTVTTAHAFSRGPRCPLDAAVWRG